MLKIKNKKYYSFDYEIIFINGTKINGNIKNSLLTPYKIFLKNNYTIFGNNQNYYNSKEILILNITNLTESLDDK